MTVLDHPIVSQRYFFPRAGTPAHEVRIDVDGATLSCAHVVLDPAWPTLVHFHGNGEIVADYLPAWETLLHRWQVNGFFAEYRGYGGSTGTPQLATMLGDVVPIARALGCEPERTVVFGRSVGSIYAIEYARRVRAVAGLILESGIHDVLERILLRVHPNELGTTPDNLSREAGALLDHRQKLAGYTGHLLVLHAEGDDLVDVSHAQRNFDAATTAATRTIERFPRGDHNSIFFANLEAYVDAVERFTKAVR